MIFLSGHPLRTLSWLLSRLCGPWCSEKEARCLEGGLSDLVLFSPYPPKPCPIAIEEIFNNKFHIIGAVGIGIAVVMVSAGLTGAGAAGGKGHVFMVPLPSSSLFIVLGGRIPIVERPRELAKGQLWGVLGNSADI